VKTKVFHFILDHRVGGPHIYVRNLSRTLASQVESILVTAGRGALTDIALLNLRHRLRWLYPLEVVLNALCLCRRFWRRKSRLGVVFDVHGAANLAPIIAARLLGVPLVWHFHETVDGFSALADLGKRIAAGIPHRHVVVAEKAAAVFRLPEAVLIPGAVDAEFWSVANPSRLRHDEEPRLHIITVGNLNPLKGADILLGALEMFGQPWELVIVGAELQTYAGYAQDLRKHAGRLESPACRVRFAGWQSPEEVRRLMAESDVFVLPSRSEACPLALLEAMATGCACIATDVGDVREILSAKEACGIVVPGESPPALAAALVRIAGLGNGGRQQMGKLARETVAVKHSLQQQAAKHLGIYKELASSSEGTT
jgi:glycosyltransferase involved in cell wall biosynthesis